jgi:hypothetical protein
MTSFSIACLLAWMGTMTITTSQDRPRNQDRGRRRMTTERKTCRCSMEYHHLSKQHCKNHSHGDFLPCLFCCCFNNIVVGIRRNLHALSIFYAHNDEKVVTISPLLPIMMKKYAATYFVKRLVCLVFDRSQHLPWTMVLLRLSSWLMLLL